MTPTLKASRAHPRAGGENPHRPQPATHDPGSSPRGRGKHILRCQDNTNHRLIPARAGKTSRLSPVRRLRRAHPRAGGENVSGVAAGRVFRGSSPRGRGKLTALFTVIVVVRLIPARAGKTTDRTAVRVEGRAHPRAGGENGRRLVWRLVVRGSSPRGRGKLRAALPYAGPRRLIPARAGKTGRMCDRCARVRAHPRAGGENQCVK